MSSFTKNLFIVDNFSTSHHFRIGLLTNFLSIRVMAYYFIYNVQMIMRYQTEHSVFVESYCSLFLYYCYHDVLFKVSLSCNTSSNIQVLLFLVKITSTGIWPKIAGLFCFTFFNVSPNIDFNNVNDRRFSN